MNSLTQDIKAISSVFDKYSSKTDEIGLYIITAEEQKDFVEKEHAARLYPLSIPRW